MRLKNPSIGAFAVGKISDEERFDVVRHACPGPGACGGMYTANTMSSALEVSGRSGSNIYSIDTLTSGPRDVSALFLEYSRPVPW